MLRVRSAWFRNGPAHRAAFDEGGGGILYTVGHSPAPSFQNNAGYYSRAMQAGKNIQRSAQMLNRARWFPAETREENLPSPRPFDALPRLRRLNFVSGAA